MKKILLIMAMLSTVIAFTSCKSGSGEEESEVVNVTSVSLKKTTLLLEVGGSKTLEYTVTPNDADDKAVTWSSSDDAVATVKYGVVTGVNAGNATITVTTVDGGKTATCEVQVVTEIIGVTGITIDPLTATVTEGETTTLTATVMPANATDKTIEWTTSDPTIATVADGVVTGIKPGSAKITATSTIDNTIRANRNVMVLRIQSPEYTTYVETHKGIEPSTGNGTEENPYLIASADNLRWMKTSGNTEGKYYKLTTDINVTAQEWYPGYNFKGHFDGDNHNITGELNSSDNKDFGFFGNISGNATIKNLNIKANINAPSGGYVGSIVGFLALQTQKGALSVPVKNCTNSGKITGKSVGGIVGVLVYADGNLINTELTVLDNCINTGEIIVSEGNTGGIIGILIITPSGDIKHEDVKMTINNCTNKGNVSSQGKNTGGIIGVTSNEIDPPVVKSGTLIVKSCTNTGIIKSGENQANQPQGTEANNFLGLLVGGNEFTNGIVTIE